MKRFSLNISLFVLLAVGFSTLSFAQQDINLFEVNGVALGSPSNYGTSPGAVEVSGVNAFVTNSVGVTGTFWQTTQPVSGTFWQTTQPVSLGSGAIFEVSPTTAANTASNAFFTNLTDGTHSLSAAISAWGTAPSGTYVMGVNANILGPIDGSGYVEINCKTGCGSAGSTISLDPETSGGISDKHFVAAASDNATNVKSSAGQVYSVDVFNNAAYPVYLKLYNAASSPTGCAATNLFKVIGVQSGTQHTVASEEGFAMGTGIGYCLTKGIADSDDTAVLLSDAVVDIGWK